MTIINLSSIKELIPQGVTAIQISPRASIIFSKNGRPVYELTDQTITSCIPKQIMHMVTLGIASGIRHEHISNQVGMVIKYTGAKPEYILPPPYHTCSYCGSDCEHHNNCKNCGANK